MNLYATSDLLICPIQFNTKAETQTYSGGDILFKRLKGNS